MTKAGKRLLEAADEMREIARGEKPAPAIWSGMKVISASIARSRISPRTAAAGSFGASTA